MLGKYRFFDLNVSGDYISFLKISENGMSNGLLMSRISECGVVVDNGVIGEMYVNVIVIYFFDDDEEL